jgi:hypothetical protein
MECDTQSTLNKESKEEIIRRVRRLFYNTGALIKQIHNLRRHT